MTFISPAQPAVAVHGTRRIADIELLRAVAVLMVLVEHMPLNLVVWPSHLFAFLQHFWRGWTGVDLFFAISGFVIGRSLLPLAAETGHPLRFANDVLAFWTRRAWRLLPSAWLWLLIPLLLSFTVRHGGFFGSPDANYQGLVAGVLDLANFRFGENYGRIENGLAFPYWSLSLEEQFYLFLPLLMFVFRRWLPLLLGIAVVLQFQPPSTPVAMMTRTGALAVGVLLAFASQTRAWRLCEPAGLADNWPARVAVLAIPLLLLGALGSDQMHIASFRIALIALLAGLLVWVASYDRDYLMRVGLPRRAVFWLGSRSYGIYLIHIPAFALTREIWRHLSPPGTVFDGRFAWRFGFTALVLIAVASELNYRLLEQPLRRRGARISQSIASRRLPA